MRPVERRETKSGTVFVRVIDGYQGGRPNRRSKTFAKGTPESTIQAWIQSRDEVTLERVYHEFTEHKSWVKTGTKRNYAKFFRHLREFHYRNIRTITSEELQAVIEVMTPTTKHVLKSFLKMLFDHAVFQGHVNDNPVGKIRLPRKVKQKKIRVLDEFQLDKLKNALDTDDDTDLAILLMLVTGLRIGEVLALRPKHLQGNRLRIENTVVNVQAASLKNRPMNSPKTDSSYRTVAIPDYLAEILSEHSGNFLLTTYYKPLRLRLIELCQKLSIPTISPHGLRHSHATFLLSKQIPLPAIAARLGHSNPSITLSTYSHLVDSMSEQILAVL
jgi:integrase